MILKSDLSKSGIQKLIDQITEYRNSLEYRCNLLVERLLQSGESVAILKVGESQLGKYVSLKSEKTVEQMGCKGILFAVSDSRIVDGREPFNLLMAIEFGAGIYYNKGNQNPKQDDFGFGVGTYPDQKHAFEDGWYYKGEDDKWHYSHGVKATMPMYSASMEMITQYKKIAREVFRYG